jgi:hypothetical protein
VHVGPASKVLDASLAAQYGRTTKPEECAVSDPDITPSQPAQGAGENPDDGRPSGEDISLPEEIPAGGETVAADTASGGAPDPAVDDADE